MAVKLSRQQSQPDPQPNARSRKSSHSSAQCVTLAISLLIVGAVVFLVLVSWATQSNEPPILKLTPTLSQIWEAEGQFYVPFTLTNVGGKTAESVQIVGELQGEAPFLERGEQFIDFLSQGEQAEGAFVFSRDPRRADLSIRVASYKLP